MTDQIFDRFGGDATKGSSEQRKLAYLMAEEAASEDIGTLLLPTTVTSTFFYNPLRYITLDYGYVNAVYSVAFLDVEGTTYFTSTGTMNLYTSLRDAEYGILDIHQIIGNCNCNHGLLGYPYQAQVSYNVGLPSGTSYHGKVLMALTTYSDIILNEMIGYGNEAPGDIGVQDYQNQAYRETRVGLLRTSFGTSARANFAHNLLETLRKYRYVGL